MQHGNKNNTLRSNHAQRQKPEDIRGYDALRYRETNLIYVGYTRTHVHVYSVLVYSYIYLRGYTLLYSIAMSLLIMLTVDGVRVNSFINEIKC